MLPMDVVHAAVGLSGQRYAVDGVSSRPFALRPVGRRRRRQQTRQHANAQPTCAGFVQPLFCSTILDWTAIVPGRLLPCTPSIRLFDPPLTRTCAHPTQVTQLIVCNMYDTTRFLSKILL